VCTKVSGRSDDRNIRGWQARIVAGVIIEFTSYIGPLGPAAVSSFL
jgi:hypothetical protein